MPGEFDDANPTVDDGGVVGDAIPNNVSPDDANQEALDAYQQLIPESFAEKGHFKDIKSVEGLFQFADGLKTKLSERPAGIPDANASDEDKAAFYKALGVPESPEGYEFKVEEGKEVTDEQKASNAAMQSLLHKANVTAEQFGILSEGLDELVAAQTETMNAETKRLDDEFDQMAKDLFGNREDEVLANGKLLVESYADKRTHEHFNGLDNKAKMVVASVLDGVRKEFINPDELPDAKPSAVADDGLNTEKAIRGAVRAIMATKEYQDVYHPQHAAAKAKKDELYTRLAKLRG